MPSSGGIGERTRTGPWWQRLRRSGWLRPSVVGPPLLVLCFIGVFVWGYLLTGNDGYQEAGGSPIPSNDVTQRVWATLVMFVGGYIPLDEGGNPVPPRGISLVSSVALGLTFVTAGSLLLLSRKVQDFVRTVRPTPGLVVIGDGATATAIIKSAVARGAATILVTDSRESPVARASKSAIPIIVTGQVEGALSTPTSRRVIRRAKHVVIATDSDALNMELHREVHEFRVNQRRDPTTSDVTPGGAPTDIVVIHDPSYADLLVPNVIRSKLPTEEVTCPAKNIAEHVCHLLVAAVTGRDGISGAVVDVVEVSGPDDSGPSATRIVPAYAEFTPGLAMTMRKWITRLGWSMSLVRGQEEPGLREQPKPLPSIGIGATAGQQIDDRLLSVRVFVGRSPAAVARAALEALHESADQPNQLTIAVANIHLVAGAHRLRHPDTETGELIRTGTAWIDAGAPADGGRFPLLVVDPDDVGLDSALVTDDTGTQWARTFSLTHSLMFTDGGWSVTGWQPGAPMGDETRNRERAARRAAETGDPAAAKKKARKPIANRYSSRIAVEHMLVLLGERGYELRRHRDDECPAPPQLSPEDVEYIAVMEHSDWLRRTWPDTSRRLRRRPRLGLISDYSGSGANKFCFDGLVKLAGHVEVKRDLRAAASYNRRIATETYPAIAASFGYVIVRSTNPPGAPDWPAGTCTFAECPCEGTGRVHPPGARAVR